MFQSATYFTNSLWLLNRFFLKITAWNFLFSKNLKGRKLESAWKLSTDSFQSIKEKRSKWNLFFLKIYLSFRKNASFFFSSHLFCVQVGAVYSIYHTAPFCSSRLESTTAWLASGLSSFSCFRSCTNASFYDPYKDGCYLKHFFVVGRSVCLSHCLSLSLNFLCIV